MGKERTLALPAKWEQLTGAERDALMVRLYEKDGLSMEEIGSLFGLSRQRVWQLLTRAGVSPRRTGPVVDEDRIVALARSTATTVEEIRVETGHTWEAVRDVLEEHGLLPVVEARRQLAQAMARAEDG